VVAVRLRGPWARDQLAIMYATPHDHFIYGRGHGERVDATIAAAQALATERGPVTSIADLSCGNAYTVNRLIELGAVQRPAFVWLGDTARGYPLHGPIEETLDLIPVVDLYVCGETIEHLDDPGAVLKQIRAKTRLLALSTPVENWDDTNAQHYWSWDVPDVAELLTSAGFTIDAFTDVDSRTYGEPYRYGIWTCH
jgi:hypothetical protein